MRKQIFFVLFLLVLVMSCNQLSLMNTQESTSISKSRSTGETLESFEAESMSLGGSYTGFIDSPFSGVGLYGTSDFISKDINIPTIPGEYQLTITAASNGDSTAVATVYLDGKGLGNISFSGTAPTTATLNFTVDSGNVGTKELKITAESDTGSWDLYVDKLSTFFIGTPPPPPAAPEPSVIPVYDSREYRNLFVEMGISEAEVDAKVDRIVNQFFYGTDDQRLYYPVGDDMAYIYTADTDDVRSEGMSYGMMMCVQLGMQEEFNRLWKWARTYMQYHEGDRLGYFAWQLKTDGTIIDRNPAPDGEEYFAMSLMMASNLWGDGSGIYNYSYEANYILDHMINHRELTGLPEWSGITNMIDPVEKQITFCIEGNSATFTDPSYHLPHFYELFGRWADKDNALWYEIAAESRQLFQDATHPTTGLAPDYSEFDGSIGNNGSHDDFRFDAWRVAMNIALDSYWWNKDSWQRDTWISKFYNFFESQGITSYKNQYKISGEVIQGDHSPGLVAMNATAALISDEQVAWEFVEDFWNTEPTSGKYRYYDGCLYMFGLLNVTGRFQIIDDGTVIEPPVTGDKPAAPSALTVTGVTENTLTVSWSDNSDNETAFVVTYSDGSNSNSVSVAANSTSKTISSLSAGTSYTVGVYAKNVYGNSNVITSSVTTDSSTTPPTDPPVTEPGNGEVVEAESFDQCYYNLQTSDGYVHGISYDHWLRYDDLTISGNTFTFRYAKGSNDGYMKVRIDGNNDSSNIVTIYPESTGGWDVFSEMTVDIPEVSGTHTVYLYFHNSSNNLNLDKFSFGGTTSGGSTPDEPIVDPPVNNPSVIDLGLINATDYSDSSQVITSGNVIEFSGGTGSYISFEADFTSEVTSITAKVLDPGYGGNIYFKLDSPTGSTFCTLYPDGGGNWHEKSNTTWPRPSGKHTIYVMSNNSGIMIETINFK